MNAGITEKTRRETNTRPFCGAATHRFKLRCIILLCMVLVSAWLPLFGALQPNDASIHFDGQTRVFRIEAGDVSYVFGINEKKQVQGIYWGKRLSTSDTFAMALSDPSVSSFESSINTTPQEFVGWGGGLYSEPDLKITFPDGIEI